MIVVKVELHSAVSGKVIDLGTAIIDNVGGTVARGYYRARTYRKGDLARLTNSNAAAWPLARYGKPVREGTVENHPRNAEPIWSLVRKALAGMKF